VLRRPTVILKRRAGNVTGGQVTYNIAFTSQRL
jgi:hypothetical protein